MKINDDHFQYTTTNLANVHFIISLFYDKNCNVYNLSPQPKINNNIYSNKKMQSQKLSTWEKLKNPSIRHVLYRLIAGIFAGILIAIFLYKFWSFNAFAISQYEMYKKSHSHLNDEDATATEIPYYCVMCVDDADLTHCYRCKRGDKRHIKLDTPEEMHQRLYLSLLTNSFCNPLSNNELSDACRQSIHFYTTIFQYSHDQLLICLLGILCLIALIYYCFEVPYKEYHILLELLEISTFTQSPPPPPPITTTSVNSKPKYIRRRIIESDEGDFIAIDNDDEKLIHRKNHRHLNNNSNNNINNTDNELLSN